MYRIFIFVGILAMTVNGNILLSSAIFYRGKDNCSTNDIHLLASVDMKFLRRSTSSIGRLMNDLEHLYFKSLNQRKKVMGIFEGSLKRIFDRFEKNPVVETISDVNFLDVLNCVNKFLAHMSGEEQWIFLTEKDGIRVFRAKSPYYEESDKDAARWPCTRAITVIDASVSALVDLLVDSSRVKETNRYSCGRDDVEILDADTKIVWNRVKSPIGPRSHDFCSIMHVQRLEDGSALMITKAVEHPSVPRNNAHIRSEILYGINIIRPLPSDPSKTEITSISQNRYSNLHPYIASKGAVQGTVSFLKQVKSALCQSESAGKSLDSDV